MRQINEIVIHCSATKEGQPFRAKDIDNWHKSQGWESIGYHYVVGLDGKIERGRPVNKIGAHCKGHNENSIGICYIGGLDKNNKPKDTRTEKQKTALSALLTTLKGVFTQATIHGHNNLDKRDCPCFDAQKEYKDL